MRSVTARPSRHRRTCCCTPSARAAENERALAGSTKPRRLACLPRRRTVESVVRANMDRLRSPWARQFWLRRPVRHARIHKLCESKLSTPDPASAIPADSIEAGQVICGEIVRIERSSSSEHRIHQSEGRVLFAQVARLIWAAVAHAAFERDEVKVV